MSRTSNKIFKSNKFKIPSVKLNNNLWIKSNQFKQMWSKFKKQLKSNNKNYKLTSKSLNLFRDKQFNMKSIKLLKSKLNFLKKNPNFQIKSPD